MRKLFTLLFIIAALVAKSQTTYFPPTTGTTWDSVSPEKIGWCQDKVDTLINYVGKTNGKAFIVLQYGKIVIEKYYGTFAADSPWYWNSAGKSMTAFLIGLAQEQGYLNIHDSLPKYLKHGFSSCDTSAEDSIRIFNQLTMTTGFNDDYAGVPDNYCTADSCLVCIAPPGTRWAYGTAPYTLLDRVIDSATKLTTNVFKTINLSTQTGITGQYYPEGYNNIYYSTARSFARFGLLISNKGVWNTDTIMHNTTYFNQMVNTSQNINLSYGYLWWLNGKSSYHLPQTQYQFTGPLVPDAPADMFAALGKNNQILNVVPSLGIVWIRMGNSIDSVSLEVSNSAADSIWVRLNAAMCNTVLGVKLLSFSGAVVNNKISLAWSTATENNNGYFLIQRSSDGINFETIGTIKGAGNSSQVLNYSFMDEHPVEGINYYRIEQTDYNNQSSFSKTIAINFAGELNKLTISPNPANSYIQLSFIQTQGNFQVEIINMLGQPLLMTRNQYKIDISQLQRGAYFLKATSGSDMYVSKFQKL